MDLLEDDITGRNEPEFTVSEISGAVKRVIEGEFGRVRIRGELGRVMVARSGHIYTDLKDERAVLSSVIWKGQAARISVRPEEGMEVIATGRLTTFPGQSRYQLVIEDLRPAGVGALMAMLEKRKKALEAEGLFAPERKKPIPYLPEVIGVVTSPQGAVIRDILHRLRDRFPRHVLIWPVAVQGDACAPQVSRAIAGFNALQPGQPVPRPDLLIVARGGGSIEDLWGFNEEAVIRAVAASDIPLISAVGHETDTTLIDYVSDRRAPTPTAAAEMAVPVRMELAAGLDQLGARADRAMQALVQRRRERLGDLSRALPRPAGLLQVASQRLDLAAARLPAALTGLAQQKQLNLQRISAALRPSIITARLDRETAALQGSGARLGHALERVTERAGARLGTLLGGLQPARMGRDLDRFSQRLSELVARLHPAMARCVAQQETELTRLERLHRTLGYQATLARGYAVIRHGSEVVTTQARARRLGRFDVEFQDGRIAAMSAPEAGKAAPKKAPKKPKSPTSDQGSLFGD